MEAQAKLKRSGKKLLRGKRCVALSCRNSIAACRSLAESRLKRECTQSYSNTSDTQGVSTLLFPTDEAEGVPGGVGV